jgi:hypothetical protein
LAKYDNISLNSQLIRRIIIRGQLGKKVSKNQFHKDNLGAGGMTQTVEHLPSKCKALSSNPLSTTKNILGVVAHICNSSYGRGGGRRRAV